jgi:hypothetical protein
MRNVPQFAIRLFKFDCALLQLLDQMSDTLVVNLPCAGFFIPR